MWIINFFPWREKQQKLARQKLMVVLGISCASVLLLVAKFYLPSKNAPPVLIQVEHQSSTTLHDAHDTDSAYALREIQYIGYLKLGNEKRAWIKLPNSVIQSVAPKKYLGLEHGQIIDINPSYILVSAVTNTHFKIYAQK